MLCAGQTLHSIVREQWLPKYPSSSGLQKPPLVFHAASTTRQSFAPVDVTHCPELLQLAPDGHEPQLPVPHVFAPHTRPLQQFVVVVHCPELLHV